MGDDQHRVFAAEGGESFHKRGFRGVVQSARGFIENQKSRVRVEGSGDRKTLTLSARKIASVFRKHMVDTVGLAEYKVLRLRNFQTCRDSRTVDLIRRNADGDVLRNRSVHERDVLRDITDLRAP